MGPGARTGLSALLIAGSLPPWDLGFLAWIALVPWLSGLARVGSLRAALAVGLGLAFGVGILAAPWLAVAAREYLGLSWVASVAILVLFAALCAQPHLVLVAPVARWVAGELVAERRLVASWLLCLGLACVWVLLERGVPRLFDVGVGYALHDARHLRQVAELGGVPLLTGWVVLVNALLAHLWLRLEAGAPVRRLAPAHVGVAALGFVVAFAYGAERLRALEAATASATRLDVAAIQGDVANEVRLAWARGDDRAAEKQLSAYMHPTEALIAEGARPDLVIWPEATFPGIFGDPASRAQRGRQAKLDRQLMRLDRPILLGAYDAAGEGARRTLWNALFAVVPAERPGARGTVQRYRKHVLLPFAEYVPGAAPGGPLRRWLPGIASFGRGEGAELFTIPVDGATVRIAPAICSEALSAGHALDGARLGAELIVNVGSDGWFRETGAPAFHLAIARMRSVETRLPQVRVANTGISALILPSGAIAERSELGEAASLRWSVPVPERRGTLRRWDARLGGALLVVGASPLLWRAFVARRSEAGDDRRA